MLGYVDDLQKLINQSHNAFQKELETAQARVLQTTYDIRDLDSVNRYIAAYVQQAEKGLQIAMLRNMVTQTANEIIKNHMRVDPIFLGRGVRAT